MMIRKAPVLLLLIVLAGLMVSVPLTSGQAAGVTAEAIGTANLRSIPSIEGTLVGEIANGTRYPVIGRSELYPWVLLGEVETALPKGWVFLDLVTINGNLNAVPFSTLDVLAQPDAVAPGGQPATTQVVAPSQSGEPTATLRGDIQVTPLDSTGTGGTGDTGAAAAPTLTPTPTRPAGVTGMSMDQINLRYGPGVEYQVVGRAQAGDVFEITGYHTQFPWLQIAFDDSPNGLAWVANNLLEVSGDVFSTRAITSTVLDLPTLTPTPAMRVSSSVPGMDPVPVSPQFAALGDSLWDLILSRNFIPETDRFGALYLQNLETGEAITFGNGYAFSGTSINKIAILLAYFGVMDGTPSIEEARDIANTMICSENVATNRLLDIVGGGDMLLGTEQTTAMMQQLGMRNTFITAPYDTTTALATSTPMPRTVQIPQTDVDQQKANPNPTNQMTVEEMGWLLGNVHQCAFEERGPLIENFDGAFTPQECRKMLYVMSENTVDGLLRAGVPQEIRVAHKHGWVNDTHGNAAVFFTPAADYVMVEMLFEPEFLSFTTDSLPTLAETSRMVYNYFNPGQPLDVVREGYIPGPDECNYTTGDPIVENLSSPVFLLENDPGFFHNDVISTGNAAVSTPTPTPTQQP
ncbi:MAG: serine hydrolase [Chloroflexota bacterium]